MFFQRKFHLHPVNRKINQVYILAICGEKEIHFGTLLKKLKMFLQLKLKSGTIFGVLKV